MKTRIFFIGIVVLLLGCKSEVENDHLDLSKAVVIISSGVDKTMQATLFAVLTEEIAKRTGFNLHKGDATDAKTVIKMALQREIDLFESSKVPSFLLETSLKKEGFRLYHEVLEDQDVLWIVGADERGLLYGIGKLLRIAQLSRDKFTLEKGIKLVSEPEYPLRGHQFGYRNTANSWDAWTVEQFDQHFREQILFGANSFENIPFQEAGSSPHFKVHPQEMEVALSEICQKYGVDYWVWTPAPKDLTEANAHEEGFIQQEAFYARTPKLNAVFVPGGDPGENHPSVLIPYLKDLATILHKYHPEAGIWVSLQGFNEEKTSYFFEYLQKEKPDWLAGLVNGPSSPPLDFEREQLPEKYAYRFYPDITHTVRCHYPALRWDQAYALTLGREPISPQPNLYTQYFRRDVSKTDGFITYSDGSHDDVNKVLWSQLGWNSKVNTEDVVKEYCQFFFGTEVADKASEGIFALEKNWKGPILENEGIDSTLEKWKSLEKNHPELSENWRWQQLILRAYYDAYVKAKLVFESGLEQKSYKVLSEAAEMGAEAAMEKALIILKSTDSAQTGRDLRKKIEWYAEELFQSVGAQTSVEKYQARGAERGAILDFLDIPLNNRWWLEDEFGKVKKLTTEEEKIARLDFIRTYESPGEGSFYDNISSAAAKHVTSETDDAIDYLWEHDGKSRKRLSTQLFQFSPVLEYEGLNFETDYLIRVAGYGEALLRANGERLEPTKYEKGFEEFKEFPLPKELIADGNLKITFDKPDEKHLNWRKQSRVTDVWLIKQ
ncbi:alpha-glucuronidase family glycosyl hydrolase [Euzebyella saccharophila]|uniref:Alpha-glucuronidase family glycosyl hydrolase n=1 Tax=Euzebyella saccharophila TaxID=679664 RepID=A0ABV8JMM2_9FLAO|nr:alpha-glucuronidase family glycosyl hydrolase [Euzebyella saccharophila]